MLSSIKSLIKRIFALFITTTNEVVDSLESTGAKARQVVRDLNAAIASHEEAAAKLIADEQVMHGKLEQAKGQLTEWTVAAQKAVDGGKDDLASQALDRAERAHRTVKTLSSVVGQLSPKVAELKSTLDGLRARRDDAQTEVEMLAARSSAAKAKAQAARLLDGVGDSTVNLDGLRDDVLREEAQADALNDLAGTNIPVERKTVAERLAALQGGA